ncbi:addiction module toxin RelE [Methylorubrum zatmanii]|nr:type II toxin-antitoxin system RelE/ParE family toxin [Methylorubrum zatmanii]ARO55312.1 addiction module toxin RelE [Methylorubrum zatmanii]KQP97291.1 addiction module toxin RelE [Methylobacterium sp. Leaf121]
MVDDRLNADAGENVSRAFKTAVFARSGRKAGIRDAELCEALREVMAGQADDLGGGVFKKRLNKNMHRSMILAKGGRYWIYEYLFAKKDRDNIDDDELRDFKLLAKGYASLAKEQIDKLVSDKDLLEICDGDKA